MDNPVQSMQSELVIRAQMSCFEGEDSFPLLPPFCIGGQLFFSKASQKLKIFIEAVVSGPISGTEEGVLLSSAA